MKKFAWSVGVVLLSCAIGSQAQDGKKVQSSNAGLDRFKQLEGEWTAKGPHGDMRVIYKVTSGGSVVMETIDPGSMHEMISMIHADGDAVLLTHYCMLGNQPHMKAMPKAGDNKIAFEFVKVTNVKSDKDMFMKSATYTFVDADTLKTEWTSSKDGKEGEKMVVELKRKK